MLGDTVEFNGAAVTCGSMGIGDRVALADQADQNASPPIPTPRYATALSRANRGSSSLELSQ